MATPRPYSERFIKTTGAGHTESYVVPPGRRAVVKRVDFLNAAATASNAFLVIAGVTAWGTSVPGNFGSSGLTTSHVAYGGETIATITGGTDLRAVVSGYLLSEV